MRDGVTVDGKPGRAYGPNAEDADSQQFEAKGRNDRHQFRFIVSSEDATELGDLKGFTRDLMLRMEKDLGTRLDWIAVDHWDTDNPHTHIVLRGVDASGQNLVIARDYISHGMRQRASEVVSERLGPRTAREIQESLTRELTQERWTNLDRDLQNEAHEGFLNLRDVPADAKERVRRSLKIQRLAQLDKMGLAQESTAGVWRISSRLEPSLRTLGERGDIIRTMQRTFSKTRREFVVVEPKELKTALVGRVAAKGLADELNDRQYLIVDGIDGRGHYIVLPEKLGTIELPIGGIVEVTGNKPRAADETIAAIAEGGVYRAEKHLEKARASAMRSQNPVSFVAAHVRRLEALRRAGVVERLAPGVWRIPENLPIKGRAYDTRQFGSVDVELTSHLPIEKQVRAIGATWLDHQLVRDSIGISESGFGSETRDALRQRLAFLVDEGFAERRANKVVLRGNLLASLRDRELANVSKSVAAESGLAYRGTSNGQRISGIYRRSLMLNSGRFAMIDDGSGFSLVPWRPVIERHLGREVLGIVNGSNISWDLSKARGLSP
jgi:type IV secretory pathway VirD2 relaxase